jgi:hypothetical protein
MEDWGWGNGEWGMGDGGWGMGDGGWGMGTLFHSAAATLLLLLRALRTRLGPDHRLLRLTHRPLGRLLPTAWFLRRSHLLLLLLLLLREHFLSLPNWSGGHKGVHGQIEPPENTCRIWVNHSGRPPQDHAHCGRGDAVSSAPTRNMAGSTGACFLLSRGSFASRGGGAYLLRSRGPR